MRRPPLYVIGLAVVLAAVLAGVGIGRLVGPRPSLVQLAGTTATASPLPATSPSIASSPSPLPSASPLQATPAAPPTTSDKPVAGGEPALRIPNLAYDSARGQVVLFGGYGGSGLTATDDTWVWDGQWTDKHPVHHPPGRMRASFVDDPATGSVLLFGGSSPNGLYDDTWSWDGTDWKLLLPAQSPPPREGGAVAYDTLHKRVLLFGGQNRTPPYRLGDTWTWDGASWTQLSPATSPSPRFLSWMAFDAARGVVVLLGGFDNINDTWTWDGSTWTRRHPDNSPPDIGEATPWVHAAAYDPALRTVVMTEASSGVTGSPVLIYTWDGSTWTRLQPSHSPPDCPAGLVFDVKLGIAVRWGCYSSNVPGAGSIWTWNGADWLKVP